MPLLFTHIDELVQNCVGIEGCANPQRQMKLLQFLAAALQLMPEEHCCEVANQIIRLVTGQQNDQVRTQAYLTLEVLYASRRLS